MSEHRLSRRAFLGTAAAAGVALALPQLRCGTGDGGSGGSVAVVGAGLAGLVAADELAREGFEVTVLEARDRVGGRVWTIRQPFVDQVAEAGGEYIDAVHTEILALVERLGLELDDLRKRGSDLPSLIFAGGERRIRNELLLSGGARSAERAPEDGFGPADSFQDQSSGEANIQAELDRFHAEVQTLAEPIEPKRPAGNEEGAELDTRSAADLLDELDLSADARFLADQEIRDAYTVEPESLSLLFLCAREKLYVDVEPEETERYRIKGGADRLPEALAEEVGDAVKLSSPVEGVEQDGERVLVSGPEGEVEADYCVLAAPLPALRQVEFSPQLPGRLRAAISGLQYGFATKTLLQYRQRTWDQQVFSGDAITDLQAGTTWDATDAQPGARGILTAYAAGEPGEAAAELGKRERVAMTVADVNELFPGSADVFSEGVSVAWSRQRFSRGSFIAPAPGQLTAAASALRRPVERIHLAGDHTDQYAGYMEGAVRSGRRAAREIIERAE